MEILFKKSFTLKDLVEYDNLSVVSVLKSLIGSTFVGDEDVFFIRYKDNDGIIVNHISLYVQILCRSDLVSLMEMKYCLWNVLPGDNCIELSIYC